MNHITIRPVQPEEVRPAIDFAQRIFLQFVRPDGSATDENREQDEYYKSGQWLMFLALDGDRLVGMACERDNTHIRKLYVEQAYQRQGIATALMDTLIAAMKAQGTTQITLASSDHALPFYTRYGFVPTGPRQNSNGLIFTPMAYDCTTCRGGHWPSASFPHIIMRTDAQCTPLQSIKRIIT
ncbi:MAG: GNAT family N-acetyltransferase [Oscillospiraceae bacterium]|nr:GNAT family N-acetyltransferase [Oscillospiraceae bacterium]